MRDRWETTCIPFLSDVFVSRCRSTVPSLFATLSSFLSIFEKSRSATDRFYSCVLLRAFPLSRRELCQRSRFMVEFYSRRHEAKQGRRKYVCMAGHRSAGLSEFGFNALPLSSAETRLAPARPLVCMHGDAVIYQAQKGCVISPVCHRRAACLLPVSCS